MNKHLSKYLTSDNPLLREWVKSSINRIDQVYEVIEGDINYIPDENQYVCGIVNIRDKGLMSLNRTVLYCETLFCSNNKLISLPNLPVCKLLDCSNNQLTSLPNLQVCKRLYCAYNQLTQLPNLPRCEMLYCFNNQLTQLPNLPRGRELDCSNNQLTKLPNLPVCKRLVCGNNPGYPFGK